VTVTLNFLIILLGDSLAMKIYLLLTLLFCASSFSQETTIEVISIEYPPFTTVERDDDGLAFTLLRNSKIGSSLTWIPVFLPPGRANRVINADQWCASFYPPSSTLNFSSYVLDENLISISLIRKREPTEFTWTMLEELKPYLIGLLRTNHNSQFVKSFTDAGIKIFYMESVETGIKMVLSDRVDYAMIDNITFDSLDSETKRQLQFSNTHLLETQITLYINNKCAEIKSNVE
jgi:polar amino acid transport system substrate-binding protein